MRPPTRRPLLFDMIEKTRATPPFWSNPWSVRAGDHFSKETGSEFEHQHGESGSRSIRCSIRKAEGARRWQVKGWKNNTSQLKSDNRDRRLVQRHRAEQERQRTCQQGTKVASHLISGWIDPRHLISRHSVWPPWKNISCSYVIFHPMALFTVFSVGN